MSKKVQQLEKEEKQRKYVAASALFAAVATLAGTISSAVIYRNLPNNSSGVVIFMHNHASGLILASVILALGTIALLLPLLYLFDAARFRKPQLWPGTIVLVVGGPIALALAGVIQQIDLTIESAQFVKTGSQTYQEAKSLMKNPVLVGSAIVRLVGQLALGFAFVLVALYAMRVGLLTRFMGFLGIIVGVLLVIPLGSPLPIVQIFWLSALGLMLLGLWPKLPKAWQSGKAEPWPPMGQQRLATTLPPENGKSKGNKSEKHND